MIFIFKRFISFVLIFIFIFSFCIVPDFSCVYASTVPISFDTLRYLSGFLLVSCGMTYTVSQVSDFNRDIASLTDYLYKYALEDSEWYPGKDKGFEWKLIINENYHVDPDPPDPKNKPKYYIPIDVGLFEIAKAWVVSFLNHYYNDGSTSGIGNLIPISDLRNYNLNNLDYYDFDTGYPAILFFTPDGHLICSYDKYRDDYYPLFMFNSFGYFECDNFDCYNIYWQDSDYNDIAYDTQISWYNDDFFSLVTSPPDVLTRSPKHLEYDIDWNRFYNPWISKNQMAYFAIGNYYDALQVPDFRELCYHSLPGSMDMPNDYYDLVNYSDYVYVPVDSNLVVDGNIVVPDDIFDVDYILDLVDSDFRSIQDMYVPDLVGLPEVFDPNYLPSDSVLDPGTEPDPGIEPVPDPETGLYPEESPMEQPETPPDGTIADWILSIPILGDILRVLINILNAVKRVINIIREFSIGSLVNSFKDMIVSIFLPDPDYLSSHFDSLINKFDNKFGYDLDFLYSMRDITSRKPENIEINIMGVTGVIANFDSLDTVLDSVRPWIASFIYFLCMLYHINNIYKMIRGTNLIDIQGTLGNVGVGD